MSLKRRPRAGYEPVSRGIGTCPVCHKMIWPTRKRAKRGLSAIHPGSGMSVYRCPHGYGYHYGHLPSRVKSGDLDRHKLRPKPRDT